MDLNTLIGQIAPAVGAAVSAHGVGVLSQAEDEAASASVRLGQRVLVRIPSRATDPAPVRDAVANLATAAGDPDALASLRWHLLLPRAGGSKTLGQLHGRLAGLFFGRNFLREPDEAMLRTAVAGTTDHVTLSDTTLSGEDLSSLVDTFSGCTFLITSEVSRLPTPAMSQHVQPLSRAAAVELLSGEPRLPLGPVGLQNLQFEHVYGMAAAAVATTAAAGTAIALVVATSGGSSVPATAGTSDGIASPAGCAEAYQAHDAALQRQVSTFDELTEPQRRNTTALHAAATATDTSVRSARTPGPGPRSGRPRPTRPPPPRTPSARTSTPT
ncbi:hypothetical protein [Streptomyces sp. NBRC 109706]|uniref:hypothetical protein n=1 Tax=Streptomyces sp. NBRC 109706 TaxID=1550035 RepID=UPI000782E5E8|nr:hypothetical protein [Streptomyces sp. NBRC 109706]